MLARHDAAGNAIPASEVEPMRTVRWREHGFYGFETAPTLASDTYGDTVDEPVPVVAGISVACLVEDDYDWNLG